MKLLTLKDPKFKRTWPLHLMLLPALTLLVVFSYLPMVGIVIAFEDYMPTTGFFHSKWIGLANFEYMLQLPDVMAVVSNTVVIAILKIILGFIAPIIFALLLNEVHFSFWKRSIQTLVYFPYFLSWVMLGGLFKDIFSVKGDINKLLGLLNIDPIYFLGNPDWFRVFIVISDVWKGFGFTAVIYLAALSGINPTLYEAGRIDGANRWKQTLHITIPGIVPIAVLLATLSLGDVLNAGFDQIFNMYNPLVYSSGDIIDTFVYRIGLVSMQYGLATAVGLFKSVVGFVFIACSYWMASRFANYRIF